MRTAELHVALTEELEQRIHGLLFPGGDDPMPERGVIGLVFPSTGRRRLTVLIRDIVEPHEGDVIWDPNQGLLFTPAYKSRATDAAASTPGAGLIILHTHPHFGGIDTAPAPSPEDLAADRADLYHLGQALPDGAVLAAGILRENGRWSARTYRFSFPRVPEEVGRAPHRPEDGVMARATAVRVVGHRLRKLPTEVNATGPAGATASIDAEATDSSVRLWGEVGQRMLAAVRVGQTGLGGVGGILAEHAARLGVGGTVMVDFDHVKWANFNRSQGATREDASVRRLKVDVGARVARAAATAPEFEVVAIEGSVVEAGTVPDLLDCDVILNAADSPWARQVLDHLAYAHLIPVINGGTEFRAEEASGQVRWGKSDVNIAGPGHPCLECQRAYTLEAVTDAQEHPSLRGERGYIVVDADAPAPEERAPSVISNNALVAGLMELRLQALILGTTPDAVTGTQRYHPLEGTLNWSAVHSCRPDCTRNECTATGDVYALPTGVDLDFRVEREEWLEFPRAKAVVKPERTDSVPAASLTRLHGMLRWATARLRKLRAGHGEDGSVLPNAPRQN